MLCVRLLLGRMLHIDLTLVQSAPTCPRKYQLFSVSANNGLVRLVDGSAGEFRRSTRQLGVGVGQTGRRGRPRRGDQLHAHVPGLHDLRSLQRIDDRDLVLLLMMKKWRELKDDEDKAWISRALLPSNIPHFFQ